MAYELKSKTPISSQDGVVAPTSDYDRDDANLQRMGKKPVLKVCEPITTYLVSLHCLHSTNVLPSTIRETSVFSPFSVLVALC